MKESRSLLLPIVCVAGIVGAMVTYAMMAPVWVPAVFAIVGPLIWISSSVKRHREGLLWRLGSVVRLFGFLLVVYALMLPVLIRELSKKGETADLVLAPEHNFTDVISELYPDRGEVLYLQASQVGQCLEEQYTRGILPEACRKYEQEELVSVMRQRLKRAVATGVKHNEAFYYDYLELLVITRGDEREIEEAAAAWKRSFPNSKKPDPRRRP